jgi:hypothetical protein
MALLAGGKDFSTRCNLCRRCKVVQFIFTFGPNIFFRVVDPDPEPDPDPDWIRIQRLCGSGSGSVLGIRIPDPDPGARKLRNISVKMQFLVIFLKKFYHYKSIK